MAPFHRFAPLLAVLLAVAGSLQGCGEEAAKPKCSEYSKNGVGPVIDSATCRAACETAEGLSETSSGLEQWDGTKCSCKVSGGSSRGVCE
mmetsp:Transcript_567/g.359  ORF Transcript_567/g.359 Transcript_567/m.359 type:complete len:90 (-) Transcript_567:126-395(-)